MNVTLQFGRFIKSHIHLNPQNIWGASVFSLYTFAKTYKTMKVWYKSGKQFSSYTSTHRHM